MERLIKELSDMRSVSGFEYRTADKIADKFRPYADEVKTNTLGSVIAMKRCGKENAPLLMIEAHYDEIGLMVTSVTKEGFLTFANVGGVDNRILPSLEVTVHGRKDIPGIIGTKPSYLQKDGKSTPIKEMAVDTGLCVDEVKKYISIGDSITIAQSTGNLLSDIMSAKSLDDRAGVAAIITVMKNICRMKPEIDVCAVASVQEEVGLRGAKTAAYEINPDMAVAIDVCHGITPDNSDNAFSIGCGAVVSKGPNLHPKLTQRLLDTAEEYGIKTEIDIDGGDTGTDAWEIQTARNGIPTALLSIPLKYMHTSVETLAVSDVKAIASLLSAFIQNAEGDCKWLSL